MCEPDFLVEFVTVDERNPANSCPWIAERRRIRDLQSLSCVQNVNSTYQMTDAAFAEARRYCIRHHTVVEDGCWFNGLYTRVVPSHAIELTAVFLDRKVAAVLARRPNGTANQQQKQELAAIIHLCGAASAKAFARRGFHLIAGERCGDAVTTTSRHMSPR